MKHWCYKLLIETTYMSEKQQTDKLFVAFYKDNYISNIRCYLQTAQSFSSFLLCEKVNSTLMFQRLFCFIFAIYFNNCIYSHPVRGLVFHLQSKHHEHKHIRGEAVSLTFTCLTITTAVIRKLMKAGKDLLTVLTGCIPAELNGSTG